MNHPSTIGLMNHRPTLGLTSHQPTIGLRNHWPSNGSMDHPVPFHRDVNSRYSPTYFDIVLGFLNSLAGILCWHGPRPIHASFSLWPHSNTTTGEVCGQCTSVAQEGKGRSSLDPQMPCSGFSEGGGIKSGGKHMPQSLLVRGEEDGKGNHQ